MVKNFGSEKKFLCSNKFFGKKIGGNKNFGTGKFLKNIVGTKKFHLKKKKFKKFWVQKYFGSGKILGQKKFGVKKN